MKKQFFSSVCAIALMSVSANAINVWETDLSNTESNMGVELANMKTALGAASTKVDEYGQAKSAVKASNAKTAIANVLTKHNLKDAVLTNGKTTFEVALAARQEVLAEIKAVAKYYGVEMTDMETAFTDQKASNIIDAEARLIGALVKTQKDKETALEEAAKALKDKSKNDYDTAYAKVLKLLEDQDLYAKAAIRYAYNEAYEANFIGDKDTQAGAVSTDNILKASGLNDANKTPLADGETLYKRLNQMKKNLGTENDATPSANPTNTDTFWAKLKYAENELAKSEKKLGKEDDPASTLANATLYAKQNQAKNVVLGARVEDLTKTKEALGKASGTTAAAKLTDYAKAQVTYNNLLAAYKAAKELEEAKNEPDGSSYKVEDGTGKDADLIAKINVRIQVIENIIAKVGKGEKVADGDFAISGDADFAEGSGKELEGVKTNKDSFGTAVQAVLDEKAKQAPDGALVQAIKTAKENIKKQEAEITKQETNIALAQAKLDSYKKALAELKTLTPKGANEMLKINEKIGEIAAAREEVKELVALMINDEGELITKEQLATDKELSARFQAAADKIATKLVDSQKDTLAKDALGTLSVQINNMNKRLGEVRNMDGEVGVWARGFGGKYSNDTDSFKYFGFQGGVDKMSDLDNGKLLTGALIGYDRLSSDTKTNSYSFGAYASYIDNSGFFTDVVAKYIRSSHKREGYSISGQNSFLFSAEAGYRFDLGDAFYIEPSLEFITGHVGKFSLSKGASEYTVKGFTPFVFKPQVFYGMNFDNLTLRIGGGAVFNTKAPEANVTINDIAFGYNAYGTVNLKKNNYGFASLSTSYAISKNLKFNLGLEKGFGGNLTQDFEVNAVVRYTF